MSCRIHRGILYRFPEALLLFALVMGVPGTARCADEASEAASSKAEPKNTAEPGKIVASDSLLRRLGATFVANGFAGSWSLDAKQILFSAFPGGTGVDRVDVASGKVTRIIEQAKDPAISPSGKKIAFVRRDGNDEEIWLADADGSNARKLADGGLPKWSADSKTVYFHSRKEQTIKAADITAAESIVKDLVPSPESWYPAVSPDGKNVAFVTGGNLVVVNLDTKARLTRNLGGNGIGLVGWSPDSKQVAYGGVGEPVGLWVLDLASGKLKRIAEGAYTMPSWSPDGKWLAFDFRGNTNWQVWAIETKQLDTLETYEPPADRYAVPQGDVKKLVAFIQQLREFRPTNVNDFMAHREKGPQAIAAAAEKILALETDRASPAYATARVAVLEPRVAKLFASPADERRGLIDELEAALKSKSAFGLDLADVNLAFTAARTLEFGDDLGWAAKVNERLADILGPDDGKFGMQARSLRGSARRLGLVGQELTLDGTTAAGKTFDWASYRGKVVLIDFWATWCGPCVAELPNVKSLYDKFHEQGFDVVGISLDQDRGALDKFLSDKGIPWTTLHQAGGQHPAAAFYGVSSIPTMLLVGRDGKVVSIRARGEELKRLLGELMQEDK